MSTKRKKPKVYKPRWFHLLIVAVLLVVFLICIAVCLIDGFGIYHINNIEKFWEVFLMMLLFFSGYIIGTNTTA